MSGDTGVIARSDDHLQLRRHSLANRIPNPQRLAIIANRRVLRVELLERVVVLGLDLGAGVSALDCIVLVAIGRSARLCRR
jgi:hypothetical protein